MIRLLLLPSLPVLVLALTGCTTTAEITHKDGTVTRIKKSALDEMTIPTDPPIAVSPSRYVVDAGERVVNRAIDKGPDTIQAITRAAQTAEPRAREGETDGRSGRPPP